MAYPPSTLPTNRTNTTPTPDTHPADHNDVNGAINDIVAELGNNPSGDFNTVQERIDALAPVGSISMYGGGSVPDGWLACDGSAVSRSTYSNLFGVLGTTYGGGDGSTTFNVPNLQGRVPLGGGTLGSDSYSRGDTGGSATVSLTTAQMPTHSHTVTVDSDAHSHGSGNLGADSGSHSHGAGNISADSTSHSHGFGNLSAVSGGSHSHGVGTLEVVEDGHSHSQGNLSMGTQDTSHSHSGANLSTSSPNHSHTSGNLSAGSHTHSTNGFASEGGGGTDNWGNVSNMAKDRTSRNTQGSGANVGGNTGGTSHSHNISGNTGGQNSSHSHTVSGTTGETSHTHGVSGDTALALDHTHSVSGSTASDGHIHSASGTLADDSHSHTISGSSASDSHNHSASSGNAGSGDAHENRQPYLVVAYMIKI